MKRTAENKENEKILKGNELILKFMSIDNPSIDISMQYHKHIQNVIPVTQKIISYNVDDMSNWRMITNPNDYHIQDVFNQIIQFLEWYGLRIFRIQSI
jgi:hypothetical protein